MAKRSPVSSGAARALPKSQALLLVSTRLARSTAKQVSRSRSHVGDRCPGMRPTYTVLSANILATTQVPSRVQAVLAPWPRRGRRRAPTKRWSAPPLLAIATRMNNQQHNKQGSSHPKISVSHPDRHHRNATQYGPPDDCPNSVADSQHTIHTRSGCATACTIDPPSSMEPSPAA